MAQDREIIYEKHPVSAERKKELREKGYQIVDARFKPADDTEQVDLTKLSVGELREHLTEQGIEFDPKASKAELLKLIEA